MNETEVVLANNAAFCVRDLEGMLRLWAPDAEVVDHRPSGFGSFHGKDELRDYYGGIFDNAAAVREDLEVVSAGDGCVVVDCFTAVELSSQVGSGTFELTYAMMIMVADGLMQRLEVFPDRTSALAASAQRP